VMFFHGISRAIQLSAEAVKCGTSLT